MRLLLLFAVLGAACAGLMDTAENVTILTSETFDDYLDKHPLVLVEFYMPWCDVCRTFKKEYERCKTLAASNNVSVEFAMVNAEDEEDLTKRFDLDFFPTFKLFKDGMLEDIGTGIAPLTGEGVIAGLRQYLGMPPTTFARSLTTVDETREWLFYRGRSDLSMKSAVMGFFPPEVSDPKAAETITAAFEDAATLLSAELRFGRVTSKEVIELFRLPPDLPSIVLYKDYDEGKEVYSGPMDGKSLAQWAKIRNKPIALLMDTTNIRRLQRDVPVIVHVFTNDRGFEEGKSKFEYLNLMRTVGRNLEASGLVTRGQIVFTLVDGKKHANWLEVFGLPADVLPAVALADNPNKAYYAMPGPVGTLPTDDAVPELDVQGITKFCEQFYAGLLAPATVE